MGEITYTPEYQALLDTRDYLDSKTIDFASVSSFTDELTNSLKEGRHYLVNISARPGKFRKGEHLGQFTGYFTDMNSCIHPDEILKVDIMNEFYPNLGLLMEMIGERGQTVPLYGLAIASDTEEITFKTLLIGSSPIDKPLYSAKPSTLAKILADMTVYGDDGRLDFASDIPNLQERLTLLRKHQ